MARLVKKKRVKKNYDGLYYASSIFMAIIFVASSLFLGNVNNALATKIQQVQTETANLQLQNDAVAVEIQQLGVSNRINEIASANGMVRNQGNIITVQKLESKTGE